MTPNQVPKKSNFFLFFEDFETFLTALSNKIISESKEINNQYEECLKKFDYYENIRKALIEQKELGAQYSF